MVTSSVSGALKVQSCDILNMEINSKKGHHRCLTIVIPESMYWFKSSTSTCTYISYMKGLILVVLHSAFNMIINH